MIINDSNETISENDCEFHCGCFRGTRLKRQIKRDDKYILISNAKELIIVAIKRWKDIKEKKRLYLTHHQRCRQVQERSHPHRALLDVLLWPREDLRGSDLRFKYIKKCYMDVFVFIFVLLFVFVFVLIWDSSSSKGAICLDVKWYLWSGKIRNMGVEWPKKTFQKRKLGANFWWHMEFFLIELFRTICVPTVRACI